MSHSNSGKIDIATDVSCIHATSIRHSKLMEALPIIVLFGVIDNEDWGLIEQSWWSNSDDKWAKNISPIIDVLCRDVTGSPVMSSSKLLAWRCSHRNWWWDEKTSTSSIYWSETSVLSIVTLWCHSWTPINHHYQLDSHMQLCSSWIILLWF